MYLRIVSVFCLFLSSAISWPDLGIPETAMNPFQYLDENNYVYENHTVITEDGYRLLLVRLPHNKNGTTSSCSMRPPILFVHGLLSDFSNFILAGPKAGFAFNALNEDYDVFLLNTRGCRFSRSHVSLDPKSDGRKFWNFSWHENGIFDLPSTINYIINITGCPKVSYVGHSQGGAEFVVMTSTLPEYNKKINVAILLGPGTFLSHAKDPLVKIFKRIPNIFQVSVKVLHVYEILPYTDFISRSGRLICSPRSILLPICKAIFFVIAGPSTQANLSLISALVSNFPAGSSWKQIVHYLQIANSDEFRQFDYGKKGNIREYGNPTPPNYNLGAVTSPVAIYYGTRDYFVSVKDASRLIKYLPNVIKNVQISNPKTNHLDYLMGTQAETLFNRPALRILDKYSKL